MECSGRWLRRPSSVGISRSVKYSRVNLDSYLRNAAFTNDSTPRSNGATPPTTTTRFVPGCSRSAASIVFAGSIVIHAPVKWESSFGCCAWSGELAQNTIGTSGKKVARDSARNLMDAGPRATMMSGFLSRYLLMYQARISCCDDSSGNSDVSKDSSNKSTLYSDCL